MPSHLRLLLLSSIALGLAGCGEEAQQIPEVRPVRTTTVSPKPVVDERLVVGEIQPRQESELSFRVSGKVVSRPVKVGDRVKKGNVVAKLDVQDYANRLHTAEADAKTAAAVLAEAQINEQRQRRLLVSGYATKVSYDAAKRSLLSAEASTQAAKAGVDMARDQIAYATLQAEFDGVITATGSEAGEVVNVGQMIAKVAPEAERDAVFAVAEAALQDRFFNEHAEVSVGLLSNPEITAKGNVREISPVADPATRTFQVKVALQNLPAAMLFGTSVSGRVKRPIASSIEVPASAIFDDGGKTAVWLVKARTGQVTSRPVTVARYEDGRVLVASGVAQGDTIVTAGANRLREGQHIKPMTE